MNKVASPSYPVMLSPAYFLLQERKKEKSTAYASDFRSPMARWLPLEIFLLRNAFHSCHPCFVCLFNLNPINYGENSLNCMVGQGEEVARL